MKLKIEENLRPGYGSLGESIVIQAGRDYLEIKKTLWTVGQNSKLEYELKKIREFIRSNWYRLLTDVSGEFLLEALDNEFENWKVKQLVKQMVQ